MTAALVLASLLLLALLGAAGVRLVRARRETFIRTYMFPPGLFDRLAKRRPGIGLKDRQLVARALRQFFLAYLTGGRRHVAMPSQIADDLWHEFILYTQHYDRFCTRAFGRFLHHTPAVALDEARQHNEGLRRVWWRACLEENINPRQPTRLPLLFAIDRKLGIEDGFQYTVDCQALRRRSDGTVVHCASDLGSGCSGGSGGTGAAAAAGGDFAGGGGESGGGGSSGGCSGGCSND